MQEDKLKRQRKKLKNSEKGDCKDSRFCKHTIGLIVLYRFHYIIHRNPRELSQEQHQVLIGSPIDYDTISG